MRKLGSKKRFALIATTTAAVFLGGGVAVAYWSSTGSGTDTTHVTAGTSSNLVITQTNTISGLTPGGAAQPINLNINNPGGDEYVNNVAITVSGTTKSGSPVAGCTSADFTVVNAAVNADVPNGATNAYLSTATNASIKMIDRAQNQDACQGVTVNLAFSSN